MKIKWNSDETSAKFSIGATRTELYGVVVIMSAIFGWICRHL